MKVINARLSRLRSFGTTTGKPDEALELRRVSPPKPLELDGYTRRSFSEGGSRIYFLLVEDTATMKSR